MTPMTPPRIMGVLNVTPDSFSDGGEHFQRDDAVFRGLALVAQGAQLLDVGGESTRPGAEPVDAAEEMRRVLPVIEALRDQTEAVLSIDTMKAPVAAEALARGATMVNDVSGGLHDPGILNVAAEHGAELVLMHRQGDPKTMQRAPTYRRPLEEVREHLAERIDAAVAAGVSRRRITVDPGIGFGKALEHNLELLARLAELRSLGAPILLGASRKSFIGHIIGHENQKDFLAQGRTDRPKDRIGGTAAAVVLAAVRGSADILRVHDVGIMREAILVALAIERARERTSG